MGKRSHHIVVAEDDPLYRRLWEKILPLIPGISYTICSSGKAAWKEVQKHPTDLLVSDIIMPDMSGFQLAGLSTEKYAGMQVVLTTGYDAHLSHFNLSDPHFHILYKPYRNVPDIVRWLSHILAQEDPTLDQNEDSWSENDDFPSVMEWKL